MRFVFTTWEGGGHVLPALLVARDLQALGREVLVVSDDANAADAAAYGLPFRGWRRPANRPDKSPATDPLRDWEADNPAEMLSRLTERVICGPALTYAEDVLELCGEQPSVIVTQELLFGCMLGAEAARARGLDTRLAVLTANLWPLPTDVGAPPFGPGMTPAETEEERFFHGVMRQAAAAGFQGGLPALNAARKALALQPLADLFEQLDAVDLIMLGVSEAFDFVDRDPPTKVRRVGPYLGDPAWAQPWTAPFAADDDRPLVLVSFSTMYQRQEPVLTRVVEALAGLPVRAVVTLGPAVAPDAVGGAENVIVVPSAPHDAILPLAALAVTHAGHASAVRPLMAGVPVLALPLGRDQPDNAARIAHRGAGLTLSPDADPPAIADAVQRLLAEPEFRQRAAALGEAIAVDAERRSAADALLELAKGAA